MFVWSFVYQYEENIRKTQLHAALNWKISNSYKLYKTVEGIYGKGWHESLKGIKLIRSVEPISQGRDYTTTRGPYVFVIAKPPMTISHISLKIEN